MDKKTSEDITTNLKHISQFKKSIKDAGGLFYQYRPCRLDDFTIYDIENIRNGVAYAQTPLNMNDPFDSQLGFSDSKIFNELIDVALNGLNYNEKVKCLLRTIVKYDLLGEITDFVRALNELKKQIIMMRKSLHQEQKSYVDFLSSFRKLIYKKLSKSVKTYFTDQSFLLFGQLADKIVQSEITEENIKNLIASNEMFETAKKQIIALRDDIYIPQFETFLSKMNISCFSVSGWNNILMWSHYANSYRGICVEYDFNQLEDCVDFIQRVDYTNKRPTISLSDLGITGISFDEKMNAKLETVEANIYNIINYLCVKAPQWNYEKEWRIISPSNVANNPTFIKMPKIKSITLGLKMDPLCKKLLLNVCEEQNIDCYELVISYDNFTINRRKIDCYENNFNMELEEEYIELLGKNLNKYAEKITELATKFTTSETMYYRSFATSNQLVIDTLTTVYFMKTCINRVIEIIAAQEIEFDTSPTKDTVNSINILTDEMRNYYEEARKGVDAIPFEVRLHNETIREIEKQLFRIDSLLNKFQEKTWDETLLSD